MLPMCSDALRPRVKAVLEKLRLPTVCDVDANAVWDALTHDKKLSGDTIAVIYAPDAGKYEIQEMPLDCFKEAVISALKGM
jgi:3-dehydroquinate synthetase